MVKKSDVVLATGRRKCAVARVRLTPGSGNVVVNGKPMADYFTSESLCGFVNQVFAVSETVGTNGQVVYDETVHTLTYVVSDDMETITCTDASGTTRPSLSRTSIPTQITS